MGYMNWHESIPLVACPYCGQARGHRCVSKYDAEYFRKHERVGLIVSVRYVPVHKARKEAAEQEERAIDRVWAA